MNLKCILLVSLALALSSCSSDQESTSASGDVLRGGPHLYQSYCAACHGASGHRVQGGVNLRNSTRSRASTQHIIENGSGIMPGFKKRFLPEELNKLIEHLETLRD